MSGVTIRSLTKSFGGKPPSVAVDALNLDCEDGEILALLGPSGCGKTTTLRCIAGLERATAGSVSIGSTSVFDASRRLNVPPNKREIGMVFQSYALWPHMTVRKNIRYPLKSRRLKAEIERGDVESTARLVECDHLLDRYPAELSGGQQQRVALARALVARPKVVLFDEPLSNLDARLREQMRSEIHELHQRTHFTGIFVTHDQSEALALGDRIAIMRDGAIEQLDSPQRVFARPATEYVAAFIGLSNRLVCERLDDGWHADGALITGPAVTSPRHMLQGSLGTKLVLRFAPDDVRLVRTSDELTADEVQVPGTVADVEFGGKHFTVALELGSTRITVRVPGGRTSWAHQISVGDHLGLAVRPADTATYEETPRTADPVSALSSHPFESVAL
jgi:iron(III) transport system ATP-binding protein